MSLLLYRVAMMAIRVALVARDGRLLFPHALASKLHAENALELAQNLLIRNRLAGFILLHDLRLFVDLLRQLRLRELLRQPSLQDGLLHVGAHRLVRQVFIVEFEFQRVSSRPGVYDARATPSVDLFSLSRSRRVVFASRRLRVASSSRASAYPFSPCPPRRPRATPASRAPRSPRRQSPAFSRAMFPRPPRRFIARVARRPSVRAFASFVRALIHSFAHACIHSRVVRAFASFAHRGDRLRVLHRLRARPRRPARRPFPDRDLLPILMRHRRRRRRRREVPRRDVRLDRSLARRSIDDPSIAPFDRSTVRRSRVDRAIDRSPPSIAQSTRFFALSSRGST